MKVRQQIKRTKQPEAWAMEVSVCVIGISKLVWIRHDIINRERCYNLEVSMFQRLEADN